MKVVAHAARERRRTAPPSSSSSTTTRQAEAGRRPDPDRRPRRQGQGVYTNNAAGHRAGTRSVPCRCRPGATPTGSTTRSSRPASRPRSRSRSGPATGSRFRAQMPDISVSPPELKGDPVSGVEADGQVVNNDRRRPGARCLLYAVARKGGKVVAAGRGAIEHLKAEHQAGPLHDLLHRQPEGGGTDALRIPAAPRRGGGGMTMAEIGTQPNPQAQAAPAPRLTSDRRAKSARPAPPRSRPTSVTASTAARGGQGHGSTTAPTWPALAPTRRLRLRRRGAPRDSALRRW